MTNHSAPTHRRTEKTTDMKKKKFSPLRLILILLPLLLVFLIDTVYLFMIPEGLFS